jgi:hypothetical protein
MDLVRVLRELRLMKSQHWHRFYASLALVFLFLMRRPIALLLIAFASTWISTRSGA